MPSYLLQTNQEESIVLSASTTDRLLRAGHGDATLLYLAVLRVRGKIDAQILCNTLRWQQERFDSAVQALVQMGLLHQSAQQEIPSAPLPSEPPQVLPEYTNTDLVRALERAEFQSLSAAIDQALGKKLTTPDQKILLGLYDDLGLSADVIFLLVNFCLERSAQRYGAGRPTRLSHHRQWHHPSGFGCWSDRDRCRAQDECEFEIMHQCEMRDCAAHRYP